MTGQKKVFIDTNDFFSFAVGTHVNTITLNPQPYMAVHSGTQLGLQVLSLQGVPLTEVVFSGFDATVNVGKYTIDPTTNSILIAGDPAVITSQALAVNFIQGLKLIYQMIPLQYTSTESLYTMQSLLSDGTQIGSTLQSTFDVLTAKMDALDQNQNINLNGFYQHVLTRSIQAA